MPLLESGMGRMNDLNSDQRWYLWDYQPSLQLYVLPPTRIRRV